MMKKFSLLLVLIVFGFSSSVKAQDDPNVGFYVDNVKVTELNCYTFKSLVVVLPYQSGYENFDRFVLHIDTKNEFSCTYTISTGKVLSSVKGSYLVLTLFDGQGQISSLGKPHSYGQYDCTQGLTRGALAYYMKNPDDILTITFWGETITGSEETYDSACDCNRKELIYNRELLTSNVSVELLNRIKKKGFMKSPCSFEVDMTQNCTYSGTKVDFNNLK